MRGTNRSEQNQKYLSVWLNPVLSVTMCWSLRQRLLPDWCVGRKGAGYTQRRFGAKLRMWVSIDVCCWMMQYLSDHGCGWFGVLGKKKNRNEVRIRKVFGRWFCFWEYSKVNAIEREEVRECGELNRVNPVLSPSPKISSLVNLLLGTRFPFCTIKVNCNRLAPAYL